jgi:hypothetical protein
VPFVEIFVPRLLPALSLPAADGRARPCLRRWLARARLQRTHCESWEQALCERFGVARQADWPVASLTLLADGQDPGEVYWLRADPAHLHAARGELILARAGNLGLAPADAQALAASLNRHLGADGMQLIAVRPERWYLRAESPQALTTTAPGEAIGCSVDRLLPRGEQALSWHRRLNEMQMVLHDHPVNAAREERGALPANSVWLWGGGLLPACSRRSDLTVWTDAVLARGLALCARAACFELPANGEAWLRALRNGDHLVALDAADGLPDPDELERRWAAPLLAAVSARALHRATLVTQHGHELLRFTASRLDLWKFWRNAPPIASRPGAGADA